MSRNIETLRRIVRHPVTRGALAGIAVYAASEFAPNAVSKTNADSPEPNTPVVTQKINTLELDTPGTITPIQFPKRSMSEFPVSIGDRGENQIPPFILGEEGNIAVWGNNEIIITSSKKRGDVEVGTYSYNTSILLVNTTDGSKKEILKREDQAAIPRMAARKNTIVVEDGGNTYRLQDKITECSLEEFRRITCWTSKNEKKVNNPDTDGESIVSIDFTDPKNQKVLMKKVGLNKPEFEIISASEKGWTKIESAKVSGKNVAVKYFAENEEGIAVVSTETKEVIGKIVAPADTHFPNFAIDGNRVAFVVSPNAIRVHNFITKGELWLWSNSHLSNPQLSNNWLTFDGYQIEPNGKIFRKINGYQLETGELLSSPREGRNYVGVSRMFEHADRSLGVAYGKESANNTNRSGKDIYRASISGPLSEKTFIPLTSSRGAATKTFPRR